MLCRRPIKEASKTSLIEKHKKYRKQQKQHQKQQKPNGVDRRILCYSLSTPLGFFALCPYPNWIEIILRPCTK
jgi:hypothetical protein